MLGLIPNELLIQRNRLISLIQFFVTLCDQQFQLHTLVELRSDLNGLLVELQRLVVIRRNVLLRRLEIRVGEFNVDRRYLLFAVE